MPDVGGHPRRPHFLWRNRMTHPGMRYSVTWIVNYYTRIILSLMAQTGPAAEINSHCAGVMTGLLTEL
jgi:hypothetical protein